MAASKLLYFSVEKIHHYVLNHCKVFSKAVSQWCFPGGVFHRSSFEKLAKIHWETPALESLLINLQFSTNVSVA